MIFASKIIMRAHLHNTRKHSYLYKFDESNHKLKNSYTTIYKGNDILLSGCLYPGYIETIKKIPRDDFVLCPVYYYDDVIADTQLAVTGSKLIDELSESSANREVCEEIGLHTDVSNFDNYIFVRSKYKTFESYTLDVLKCHPCNSSIHAEEFVPETFENNDRKKKVQIIIHGSMRSIHEKIMSITERLPSNDLNRICGFRILSQQDAYEGALIVERYKNFHNKK